MHLVEAVGVCEGDRPRYDGRDGGDLYRCDAITFKYAHFKILPSRLT